MNINKNFYSIKDGIHELKYSDFNIKNKNISLKSKKFKNNKTLIIFYAPWCSHCKNIVNDIKELSLSNLNKFHINTVNINDIENKNHLLAEKIGIESIPTMMILKDNKLEKYDKPVNFENLFYYINMNID